MLTKTFRDNYKRTGRLGGITEENAAPDYDQRLGAKRDHLPPQNQSPFHVWVCRISIIVAILLLISFYFIPFPINLILFIISLILFLMISFVIHIRIKRQSKQETNSYPSIRLSRDPSFVDVPLELINENGLKQDNNLV